MKNEHEYAEAFQLHYTSITQSYMPLEVILVSIYLSIYYICLQTYYTITITITTLTSSFYKC